MERLLIVENLEKRYERMHAFENKKVVTALQGVSFSIGQGSTLALVGESGSGKSTLGLCIAGLERPTSGKIVFNGNEITDLDEKQLREVRRQIQLVFQDPARALNPRFSALEIVSEPLLVQGRLDKREREARARVLFEQVGIPQEKALQQANEFSGGQRQRLAIARALALKPKLLILDEALSALDCSVQAQIANLLMELQASLGLTYLFITHDFKMAGHLADEIAVMEQGKVIEHGATDKVLRTPGQEVTRRLIAATPRLAAEAPAPRAV
ncbi:MAG TPA: dipeptide/oligopeptide/nickel ABC transporter ATP-binding protein [Candidatus Angelobacter sp.]|nr:dipeptide/oligopeptide/nickel ABC transporter ATP-binding protein [Candidatus Angelobacter sp.]